MVSSMPDNQCSTNLSVAQIVVLAFTAQAGVISLAAVLILFLFVLRNVIRLRKSPVRTHIDIYMMSLLLADFIQGIGAIMDIRWVTTQRVFCGSTCNAQGALKILGETGVGLSILAVTIHTFAAVFFRWVPPRSRIIPIVTVTIIWTFTFLFVIVGYFSHPLTWSPTDPENMPFFAPVPFWCWVSANYTTERLLSEYVWLWVSAFTSIILYCILFFFLRGNIRVDPNDWTRIKFTINTQGPEDLSSRAVDNKQALKMLWYPIAYTILVVPLSVARWVDSSAPGRPAADTPFVALGVGIFIFGLSGLVNVILFIWTRPSILLFGGTGSSIRQHSLNIQHSTDLDGSSVSGRRVSVSVSHGPAATQLGGGGGGGKGHIAVGSGGGKVHYIDEFDWEDPERILGDDRPSSGVGDYDDAQDSPVKR